MSLIAAAQISEPKLKVSPPAWVFVFVWAIFVAIFIFFYAAQPANPYVKYSLEAVWGLAMLGVVRNQLKGNYLVTLQANSAGLYFQTSDANQYFYVPWKNVGQIEKAIFPLISRGMRIEITGDSARSVANSDDVGNVRIEGGRTFVYTIPQLHHRDRLIKQLESFRSCSPI